MINKTEPRNRPRLVWVVLLVSLSLGLLGGCGSSETVAPTGDTNPFLPLKAGNDSTLEVMTWNLETFAKSGTETLDHVTQVIEALDVDVIAIQEIYSGNKRPGDFGRLTRKIEGWTGYEATSDGWMDLGFLVRDDTLLTDVTFTEILTGNSREFPRNPLVLQAKLDGKPFVVINNHYKCCGDNVIEDDNDWDEETRRRDANLLLQQYVEQNLAGQRVIIVGDFNDELDDAPANNVFQNFLDAPQAWRFADLPIALDSGVLWSYPGWPSHIDHILINEELFVAFDRPETSVYVVPVHTYLGAGWSGYDNAISDHLPVLMRIKL